MHVPILVVLFAVPGVLCFATMIATLLCPHRETPGRVVWPAWVGRLFGGAGLGVCTLGVLAAVQGEPLLTCGLALCLTYAFAFGCLSYLNTRIDYDAAGFTRRNWCGKTRRYSYVDLTGKTQLPPTRFSFRKRSVNLWFGKHKVTVDAYLLGKKAFLKQINAACDGVPNRPYRDLLFHGHIDDPYPIIVFDVLFLALFLGMIVFAAAEFHASQNAEDTQLRLSFQSVEEDGKTLTLYGDDNTCFRLYAYRKRLHDADTFLRAAQQGEVFDVTAQPARHGKEPFFVLCAVQAANGTVYLTRAESDAAALTSRNQLVAVFAALTVLWLLMIALQFIAGRHPARYPRLARMLFKKEAIHE